MRTFVLSFLAPSFFFFPVIVPIVSATYTVCYYDPPVPRASDCDRLLAYLRIAALLPETRVPLLYSPWRAESPTVAHMPKGYQFGDEEENNCAVIVDWPPDGRMVR